MIFLNKQFVALFCLQALLARSDGCFYTPMRCRRQVQSFSKTPSDIGSHHRRSQENVGITLNGSNMSVRSVALRWNPIIWVYLQQFAKHGGSCGKWRLAQLSKTSWIRTENGQNCATRISTISFDRACITGEMHGTTLLEKTDKTSHAWWMSDAEFLVLCLYLLIIVSYLFVIVL